MPSLVVSDEMWKIINESVERLLRSSGSFADSNKFPVVVYGPVKPSIAEAFAPEPVVSDFSSDKVVVDVVDAGVDKVVVDAGVAVRGQAKRQVNASSFSKSSFLTKFGSSDGGLPNKRKRPLLDDICPFSNAFGENHTEEQYAEFELWINSGLKKRNKYVYFYLFLFVFFSLFMNCFLILCVFFSRIKKYTDNPIIPSMDFTFTFVSEKTWFNNLYTEGQFLESSVSYFIFVILCLLCIYLLYILFCLIH